MLNCEYFLTQSIVLKKKIVLVKKSSRYTGRYDSNYFMNYKKCSRGTGRRLIYIRKNYNLKENGNSRNETTFILYQDRKYAFYDQR